MGGGISAKTFDMRVANKFEADHVFSAISKEEVAPISAFLKSKNLKISNEMEEIMAIDPISEDEDDDDDEDASIPSEDEKPKKSKDKVKKPARPTNDDEDESGA